MERAGRLRPAATASVSFATLPISRMWLAKPGTPSPSDIETALARAVDEATAWSYTSGKERANT